MKNQQVLKVISQSYVITFYALRGRRRSPVCSSRSRLARSRRDVCIYKQYKPRTSQASCVVWCYAHTRTLAYRYTGQGRSCRLATLFPSRTASRRVVTFYSFFLAYLGHPTPAQANKENSQLPLLVYRRLQIQSKGPVWKTTYQRQQ